MPMSRRLFHDHGHRVRSKLRAFRGPMNRTRFEPIFAKSSPLRRSWPYRQWRIGEKKNRIRNAFRPPSKTDHADEQPMPRSRRHILSPFWRSIIPKSPSRTLKGFTRNLPPRHFAAAVRGSPFQVTRPGLSPGRWAAPLIYGLQIIADSRRPFPADHRPFPLNGEQRFPI